MKNNPFKYLIFAFAIVVISLNACKKDDLPDVEEEELITTISLTFTNINSPSDVRTVTWRDLDGDGGNAPIITPLIFCRLIKLLSVELTSTPPLEKKASKEALLAFRKRKGANWRQGSVIDGEF